MKTFYSPAHLEHRPAQEFERGRMTPAVEVPERAEAVRRRIATRAIGPILSPVPFDDAAIARVHDQSLVRFLARAHDEWRARYGNDAADAIPSCWPAHGLRPRERNDVEAKLGAFVFDTATPITRGTWPAARTAADVALSAAKAIFDGERSAFALTRPPGHHAAADFFGGYCYLNNVAIAAQWLCDRGLRPAILDVDYHHGNGTQAIFYSRKDVFFCSLHADPASDYPHYSGFADEQGAGEGEEATLNLPMPRETEWRIYGHALARASEAIASFGADALLVSLGLDTFAQDPISFFRLQSEDYLRLGAAVAKIRQPTLFVFEGGYHLESLAENTTNVLEGFLGA
ncbi:MAG TPA: histone deacetylase family protein [Rhizomicrobium sp.]|nr:histone deacetylase family protein [Rhizomicrobium sp.]